MYSMFQAISGGTDWGDVASPLLEIDFVYCLIFCFYVSFTVFALMNIVTSVFVENATKEALHDRDRVIEEQLEAKESFVNEVKALFREADDDGSGTLTWDEF